IGPLHVLDELRSGPPELIYLVHDPQSCRDLILRRLDASVSNERKREYRQRFAAAAAVQHENVARTVQILDLPDGPGVLQEWPQGLASGEWRNFPGPAL